jgi:hypothetical protein
MNTKLQQLRDAVRGRGGREVEVEADGRVREVNANRDSNGMSQNEGAVPTKPTKLAPRTFGA